MKAWLVCQGTGPGKDISTTKLKSSWALDGLLLSNDNGLSNDTVSLILFLLIFLQVCAQKAIFAEGHCVSTSECRFSYFQLVGYLFVLFFISHDSCCSPGSLSSVARWRQHELFNSPPRPSWKTALRHQCTRRPIPWKLKLSESREGQITLWVLILYTFDRPSVGLSNFTLMLFFCFSSLFWSFV